MAKAPTTPGHGAPRERWSAIAGLACALVLAGLASFASVSPDAASARPAPAMGAARGLARHPVLEARAAPGKRWAAFRASDLRDSQVGAFDPAPQGQLDVPRLSGKPLPVPKRADAPRATLAARLDAAVAILTRRIRACALPPRHTPLADRPLTANCPAQGPPLAA